MSERMHARPMMKDRHYNNRYRGPIIRDGVGGDIHLKGPLDDQREVRQSTTPTETDRLMYKVFGRIYRKIEESIRKRQGGTGQ